MNKDAMGERDSLDLFFFVILDRDFGWRYCCNCLQSLYRIYGDPEYAALSEYIRRLQLLPADEREKPYREALEDLRQRKYAAL